ncbi:hypothetical protein CC86DRAFT_264582, partial [Ophiobolus disseminans]
HVNTSIICVIVGSEVKIQEFLVHEGLICGRSDFFKNAPKEPWVEANERKVMLAEEDPDIFALYLELLYTSFDECIVLSKLYVLAEMLMDDNTKNLVLSAMVAKSNEVYTDGKLWYPGVNCAKIIYEGTREGSPARRLLVEFYTDNNISNFRATKSEYVLKDFLLDLAINLTETRPLLHNFKKARTDLEQQEKDCKKK